MLKIGCHVSIGGGVFNAPKNAADLGCETFQIFSRSPRGGPAAKLTPDIIAQFQSEMVRYGYSYRHSDSSFVIHCPYYINFGSTNSRIYHGSSAVVREELERGSLLGAKFVMTHLGSAKDLGHEKAFEQAKKGLVKILTGYEGSTQFLMEIAAGAGQVIGGTFEELAELMEPLVKFKTFGGICFDTQHAFASGYDLRTLDTVKSTFKKFDKVIGLKWLKMSHVNDSKPELGARKDRHDHIGEGKVGKEGFKAFLQYLASTPFFQKKGQGEFVLILETEHDKVKADIKILKDLRDQIKK